MAIHELITGRLRADILDGVFAPGARLVELQLTERYGVGRAAVRSALVELDSEGLVERSANRGATVRRVPVVEAIQLNEARQALESLIAACAATNATEADRHELLAIGTKMRLAVEAESFSDYSDLNRRLHRRLREMSGHPIASELVANLRARSSHHQFRLALLPGRATESLPQHERIIAAVVSGDPDAARGAMWEHLESVVETLRHWQDLGVEI